MYHIFLSIYASFNFSFMLIHTTYFYKALFRHKKHKDPPNDGKSDKLFTFRSMYCMGTIFLKGVNTRHQKECAKACTVKTKVGNIMLLFPQSQLGPWKSKFCV